jgi:hypothetical protein
MKNTLEPLFVKALPVAIAYVNKSYQYVAVSHKWCQMHQLPAADKVVNESHFEFFPERELIDRLTFEEVMNVKIAQKHQGKIQLDVSTFQEITWEVSPWLDAKGEVLGLILVTQEVPKSVATVPQSHEVNENTVVVSEFSKRSGLILFIQMTCLCLKSVLIN